MNGELTNSQKIYSVLSSLTIAMIVSSQYLAAVLGLYLNSESGWFPIIISFTVVLMIGCFLLQPTRWMPVPAFALTSVLIIYYIITLMAFGDRTNLGTTDFLCMCLVPILAGVFLKPNYRMAMTMMMTFLLLGVPVFQGLFTKGNNGSVYDAVSMGRSYAILPLLVAGILHFTFYRKTADAFEKILYIVCCCFIIQFVVMSYRGALLSLFIAFFFAFRYFGREQKLSIKQQLAFLCLALIALVVIFNWQAVLHFISLELSKRNIRIAAIDKALYLLSVSGTEEDHSRISIWVQALQGIADLPIFGHGLSTFQYYTGIVFPHNFVLQVLYDGGVVLGVPLIWILLSGLKKMFGKIKEEYPDKFAFLIMLCCSSIPRAIVSAECWRILALWLLYGFLLSISRGERE